MLRLELISPHLASAAGCSAGYWCGAHFRREASFDRPKPLLVTRSYFLPKLLAVMSRSSISERGWNMAKFTLGDVVRKTKGGDGVVRAIFTTRDGELTYAVEKDGALDFVDETKLSHQREPELAA
jgi:hypothetical protein